MNLNMDYELNIELSIKLKLISFDRKKEDRIGAQGGTRTPTPYGTRSLV